MKLARDNQLMDNQAIEGAIERLAFSIVDDFSVEKLSNIALLGLQRKGAVLAGRLANKLHSITEVSPLLGTIDISMHRDDIGKRPVLPVICETKVPFDVNERIIILVDDVLSTGRTIRAALDAVTDYGRPGLIKLAVLVDRGGREFPIQADYVGLQNVVPAELRVKVAFGEVAEDDAVFIIKENK